MQFKHTTDNKITFFSLKIKLPRLVQALLAAVGDLYLYRFSWKLSGPTVAQWTLLCQLTSWFMFYCCTRTLTNSMETMLTTVALYYYPWPGKPRWVLLLRNFLMHVLSGACKFEKARRSRNVAFQAHALHRSNKCLFDFMASMSWYGRAIQCTCSPSLSLSGSRVVRAPGRVTYMPQEVGWKPVTG